MNLQNIATLLSVASKDEQKNIEVLKQALRDNDYKLCGVSAQIMLGQMKDMGMDPEQAAYWESLAVLHLPYSPTEALKE